MVVVRYCGVPLDVEPGQQVPVTGPDGQEVGQGTVLAVDEDGVSVTIDMRTAGLAAGLPGLAAMSFAPRPDVGDEVAALIDEQRRSGPRTAALEARPPRIRRADGG